MKGILKWLKNSSKMKRWMFLCVVGISLVLFGMATILDSESLTTLKVFLVVGCFIIGFTSIVLSIIFMQKRTLELLVEQSDTRKEKSNVNTLIFNKKVFNQGPKVVVIGGGTGLNSVLKGLKHYTDNITAIVTVSDYGNGASFSRDQLKLLPIEDIKESLVALSYDEESVEKLLNFQFKYGKLANLSFGDIFFFAMNQTNGSFYKSIENSKNILNMTGRVIPGTLDSIKICAELEDGTVVENRDSITEMVAKNATRISRVYITPTNTIPAPGVLDAIREADAIVIGPGSLYTNVIPNLLIKGIAREIKKSRATKIYVSNIMTEMGQTDNYTLSDHLKAIVDYVGESVIDYCIYDTGEVVPEFIQKYNLKGADIVIPDIKECKALGINLVQRNLSTIEDFSIRHDPDVIASTIIQLVCDELKFADMQNNSQYMMLNSKLKDSKKEIKKKERKEKKDKLASQSPEGDAPKKKFERNPLKGESKFQQKYKTRIQQIKDSNNPINKFKKKKIHRDDEEQEFQGAFDYREFITNNAEEIAEAEEKSSNKGKRGDNQ